MAHPPTALILGAGPIGTGFAAALSAAGYAVRLVDPSETARAAAGGAVDRHRSAMARAGLPAAGKVGLVEIAADIAPAGLVIEAGPERAETKQEIFTRLLAETPGDTILTSASSAIPMSRIVPDMTDQSRCLIAHPANPPSLLRVLELVPAAGTAPATMTRAEEMFRRGGFDPVRLGHEVPAFVFNRLQSALLREAYRLVAEGVVDVAGLDRLVRDGLGPRWALSGPFETADLNTEGGIAAHAERLGPAYAAIGAARGETDPHWSSELVAHVETARRTLTAADALPARRAWRETALADLLATRRRLLDDAP